MTHAAPSTDRVSALEAQLVHFAARQKELELPYEKLKTERDEYRKLVLLLREENERLKRGLLGQKAERLPAHDAQLSLAILGLCQAGATGGAADSCAKKEEPEIELELISEHIRKKPVRKALPAQFPRVPIEIVPPEVEREGTCAFDCIGSDIREVLERRPASTVVVQLIYKKFVRKDRERMAETEVLVPQTVELPIERGTAGPGLLADTLVRRFQDHQPLNRLEGIYGREGLALSRATLCTWHMQLADLCRPLVEAMFQDAYRAPYVCVDATGVLVLDKDRCRHGHFWVLAVPERHVLFRYSPQHNSAAVDALLPNYKGYLVVDAHTVYDHLFRTGLVIEVGCWSHCRRYFFKALPSDPDRAKVALAHIAALFRIERTLVGATTKKREQVRKDQSTQVVAAFFQFCDLERERVLDESPLFAGIRYATNQRQALERFLQDGRLPLHNNISELNLRRQAVGRKNWLFCGSDNGAETNTVFVSLLASCRMHQLEPQSYMRDLLCLLPRWPMSRLLDLAPVNWANTLKEPQTQQLLDHNVFRRALLSLSV